jgi:hypothetical protein
MSIPTVGLPVTFVYCVLVGILVIGYFQLNAQADAHFRTSVTNQDPPGHHFHELYIDHQDMTDLAKGLMVTIVTTTDNSHDHKLEVS